VTGRHGAAGVEGKDGGVMDDLIRSVSIAMARSSSRRDFLSKVVRTVVGVGIGVGAIFGGSRMGYADQTCTSDAGVNCAASNCQGGNSFGCTLTDECNACMKNANGFVIGCYPGRNGGPGGAAQYWSCCCNHQHTACFDCHKSGSNHQLCQCVKHVPGYTC
jgi:hypothetical protein